MQISGRDKKIYNIKKELSGIAIRGKAGKFNLETIGGKAKNYGLNLENVLDWNLGVRERKNWIILEAVEIERDLLCFAVCWVYFDLTSAILPLGGKG